MSEIWWKYSMTLSHHNLVTSSRRIPVEFFLNLSQTLFSSSIKRNPKIHVDDFMYVLLMGMNVTSFFRPSNWLLFFPKTPAPLWILS